MNSQDSATKIFYACISANFFIFSYLLNDVSIVNTAHFKFPVGYFIILMVFILFLIKGRVTKSINKNLNVFLMITTIVYVILPFVSFNIRKFDPVSNLMNVMFGLLFILVIFFVSNQIKTKVDFNNLVKSIAIGNGLLLFPMLVMHISQLTDFSNYIWLFEGERLNRANFGFRHSNFSGMIILIQIYTLGYFIFTKMRYIRLVSLMSIEIILIAALISTGNRAAVYALFFSLIIGGVAYIINKVPKLTRYLMYFYAFTFLLVIFLFVFDWNDFYSSSLSLVDRYHSLSNVMKQIPIYGNYLFGIAPIGQIDLNTSLIDLRTDNWYIQTIVLYGLIGLVLMILLILYIIISILRSNLNYKINMFRLIILTSGLIYAMMEASLFTHGYSWSFLVWIVILIDGQLISRYEMNAQ